MNILSLTAGAASMYCGSCLRDNALAAELIARGHDVTLVPVYTPTLTDEPNVSQARVFFGGISVYLQQHVPLFRWTPAFLDRFWDSASVIRTFAKRQIQVDARLLGEMTVSMLRGEHGHQRKELDKMIAWLRTQPAPDVINLPFTLLIGLAGPLREAFGRPIACTLQGEDLFLDQLHEPYKNEALKLIRQQVKSVDRFIAVSDYYARYMAGYLSIPPERIRTVPLGINLKDYDLAHAGRAAADRAADSARAADVTRAAASILDPDDERPAFRGARPKANGRASAVAAVADGATAASGRGAGTGTSSPGASGRPFTIGYFARIAPEKGLDRLVAAYRYLRKERGLPASRLEVAGYLGADNREYLDRIELSLRQAGLDGEYRYHGELDRSAKIDFFKQIDVFSMPAPYREPKGFSVLEAMASGVPVVQPGHGAFPEVIEKTGGGLIVKADDVESLAEGIWQLFQDREERLRLGRQGAAGVREHYSIQRMAAGVLAVYTELVDPARAAGANGSSSTSRSDAPASESASGPGRAAATRDDHAALAQAATGSASSVGGTPALGRAAATRDDHAASAQAPAGPAANGREAPVSGHDSAARDAHVSPAQAGIGVPASGSGSATAASAAPEKPSAMSAAGRNS